MYLYQEADSIFHSLHPLTKLCVLFLAIAVPFLAETPLAGFFVLAAYIALLLLGRGAGNLKKFWKLLLLFWTFTFLIWIVIPKLRHMPWSFSAAAMLATRVDTFVVAGLLFVTVTRIEEFTYGLRCLGVPYKGAFALSLGFRLVPLFYQNLETIVIAQRSRGVDLDSGSMIEKAKKYLPIMGILISFGIRNADLTAMSLEAKGFGYSPRRTSFLQPKFGWKDLTILVGGVAAVYFLW